MAKMVAVSPALLAIDEPPAFTAITGTPTSPFFLVCDHASNRVPRRLGTLGLQNGERERHIAWDIGAAALTHLMADPLGAFAILQNYSRLVIDCNRDPTVADSIVEISEYTDIPANRGLSAADRDQRKTEIFDPYHARLRQELDARHEQGVPTVLVSLHSFTPVFKGERRVLHAGILYHRDTRVAGPLMALLRADTNLLIGDNEPYALSDESDYTVPVHGERRGLPHVEIEVRQDLIADAQGQRKWAQLLSRALVSTWREMQARSEI